MRRTLAAAILGISLWVGSLAWSGFIMTSTVLNPDRSRDVAEALLEDEAVRAQIVDNIANGVDGAVPAAVPIPRATVEAGAEAALDSPVVEDVFLAALVQAHRAFLGEADVPRSVDGTEFGSAARDSLVASRPELAGLVPEAPSLAIPLPTERIPNAGPVRQFLLTAVPIAALVAAAGALMALVVTTNRPGVVRRAGIWAMALSVFVLVFAYGLPAVAERYAPDQAAVIAALVSALARATRGPALALFAAGVGGVVVSMLWRPTVAAIATPVAAPRPPRRSAASVPAAAPTRSRRRRVVEGGPPARGPSGAARPPGPAPAPTAVHRAQVDATQVQSAAPPTTPTNGAGERTRPGARFVDGVGWIHHGPDPIPARARWVPGVGYVLDD